MFTKHKERQFGELVELRRGPTVRLLEQTQDHQVVFIGEDGAEKDLPASEFHALFREATPKEAQAFLKNTKGDKAEPADADN